MSSPALKDRTASADLDEMAGKAHEASDFLKALSHEARLVLLCSLAQGECSVGQLEDILGARQSTVSQQLARLRLDNLVKPRRDGKTVYYSLADENVRVLLKALHSIFCAPKPRKRAAVAARR